MDQNEKVVESMKAPNPFGNYDLNSDKTADKIKEFYDQEQYCKVEGTIEMTKVTGQLSFRLMGER
jgi:hypothetical protein